MVKVLIYSSKEIYDNASYEGRAEADIIAYSVDEFSYQIVKNRNFSLFLIHANSSDLSKYGNITKYYLKRHIERLERDEWIDEVEAIKLQEKYKTHPMVELGKNI